ncbi:MAG: indole-3-glycerol-phosphate synthase [bacterium]|nr:indole-3-glycerol-phosphate synthase [bacterium]
MKDILKTIIQHKFQEIKELKKRYGSFRIPSTNRSGLKAILRSGIRVKIIPELKPSSPSEGPLFRPSRTNLIRIIKSYDRFPLGAISILTDKKFFNGSFENIGLARTLTSQPILCKEFIVDPYQIKLARYFGADAILLIAEALSFTRLLILYQYARSLGMDVLFEFHHPSSLPPLLDNSVEIIGINNRDLSTLKISPRKCLSLRKRIPSGRIIVAESGLENKKDILKLARHHFHAALIGTSILKSRDMEKKLRELVYYDE